MKKVTKRDWLTYKNKLAEISRKAADELTAWIDAHGGVGVANREELIAYAYALTAKYGEAGGAYTAQYYDDMARLSGVTVPAAEIAEIPSYREVAKAINGTIKQSGKSSYIGSTSGRLVKQVSADTLQKNALRDGAEWAWIPAGDTCVFCLTLASRGWQKASKKALKNGHAEHIHANCDCTYAVRFDKNTTVEGYEPEKYLEMYKNAEGDTPQEKINSMRRIQYQKNREKILEQKRINYKAISLEKEKKSIINDFSINKNVVGTKGYRDKFSLLTPDERVNSKIHDKAVDMLNHRSGTDYEDMYLISLEDGLVKGTQTKVEYYEGVTEELRHQHVWYNESLNTAIKNNSKGTLISIHNHPGSLPPSGGDFESQFNNGYKGGVIACHNGDIYYYEVGKKRFSSSLYDLTVDKYKKQGYSVIGAYEKTLKQFEKEYGIIWRKL